MLIAKLKNQLGNQMMQYAAVKSIAEDKKFTFQYYRQPMAERYINDRDTKYGNDIRTLFLLPEEEYLQSIPADMAVYNENTYRIGNRGKFYFDEAININDNVVMDGLFESFRYFKNRRNDVIKWFKFQSDTVNHAQKKLNEVHKKYYGRPVISVHFRVGKDYTTHGLTLKSSYWMNAARKAQKDFENPIFLCFYDTKTRSVTKFMKKFDSLDVRGSLIEDMCLISMCDAHIICNSTFSTMSAFIDPKFGTTYCPIRYPSYLCYRNNEDCYLTEWVNIKGGSRNLMSNFFTVLQFIGDIFRG
ncbi:alpha-1,2-fucosyltransferase [Diplocloster hominis]|uniref:alpha-1,2-fucosyltransferase n=1 Tax=Diplocloster hominis TaxID=3079010 RepID=UPI0031BA3FF0